MTIAVLDTNVLASGFVRRNPQSPPVQLLDAWHERFYTLVISDHIITELIRTLREPYFNQYITEDQVARLTVLLRRRATLTSITVNVEGVATHPEDDLTLATAVSAKSQYLVTGDTKLQKLGAYEGVVIVSPRQFLDILVSEYSKN